MELSEKERRFVEPYLTMKVGESKRWRAGGLVGALICLAALCLRLAGVRGVSGPRFLLLVVVGMVVIETSVDHRRKVLLARILQKYHAAARDHEASAVNEED